MSLHLAFASRLSSPGVASQGKTFRVDPKITFAICQFAICHSVRRGPTQSQPKILKGSKSFRPGGQGSPPTSGGFTCEQKLPNENAASELAKLLECACLFWRFCFDPPSPSTFLC